MPRSRRGPGLRSESGQSLLLALMVLFALSISLAGVYSYLGGNEGHFNRDQQDQRALSIAEAGLNDGLASVTKADPSNAVVVGSPQASLSSGGRKAVATSCRSPRASTRYHPNSGR